MTVEEKAEQYADENKSVYQNTFVKYSDDYEEIKQAVLYGLAEGRKEGYEKARKESNYCIELLQNEKAELAEDFCKQLEELKTQIEKMKNCGNCSEPCWNPPIVRRFECIYNNHSLWRLRI